MRILDIVDSVRKNNSKADTELVKRAYEFAKKCHGDQLRDSGEPYIQHPLHVAYILAGLNMDEPSIVAALLHDTVEDTDISLAEIKKEFGEEVAALVDGLTKITKMDIPDKEARSAESIRKVIMASARDIRIIFIKLADRLHNMRTIGSLREERRKRIAKEAMDVYAPIAYKLGLHSIKSEMEDLAFEQLEPMIFRDIKERLNKGMRQREKEIERIKSILVAELVKNGVAPVAVYGRPKHIYSIYKKMKRKGCCFESVYDQVALRVIAKSIKECYEVIGVVHNLWKPIPEEFDDYIAMPKPNMYQSLHTAVMVEGQPVEIQVRTEEMDKIAEGGIAAHWKYKGVYGDQKFDSKLDWLKQILQWQKEMRDSKEFMEMLHVDFFEDEIFAFTPRGDSISLPKGACAIDFAYAVHTSVGDRCIGAKVNGKFVPLRTQIKNGDQVEILTSKLQRPSRDWLKFVVTSKAKTKIRQFVEKEHKVPAKAPAAVVEEKKELEECIINVAGICNPKLRIAKCCHPLPGDPIVALAAKTGKVMVHRLGCHNIKKLARGGKSKLDASWIDVSGVTVEVKVDAINRTGLFAEILNSLVSMQTPIKSASAKPISNEMVQCSFTLESKGLQHLQDVVKRIKRIKDVKKVYIGEIER
ncbi:MAG TPA: bifunctional (p)ppGpp synthetase/guanosine-3',5'-bis(diphosphate) 3'-pyrophosphohydrolase [Nanoarchaeota archaeon]|nr:bifunctional (p)ppGpp synthetase/guanosine-3',5'-bis(diphosphate) 3'-pyrophosphohydrolase [Nanoarchaeota archaeon]